MVDQAWGCRRQRDTFCSERISISSRSRFNCSSTRRSSRCLPQIGFTLSCTQPEALEASESAAIPHLSVVCICLMLLLVHNLFRYLSRRASLASRTSAADISMATDGPVDQRRASGIARAARGALDVAASLLSRVGAAAPPPPTDADSFERLHEVSLSFQNTKILARGVVMFSVPSIRRRTLVVVANTLK